MWNAAPGSLNSRNLMILPYDDSIVGTMTPDELTAYEGDVNNYSVVPWRAKQNPKNHWNVPYVSGKKYYVRWAHGLDFEKMTFGITSWLWEDDEVIEIEMPHYDVREAVYVDTNQGNRVDNNTIATKAFTDLALGDNLVRNDADTRRINLIFNGDDNDLNTVTLTGVRCVSNCVPDVPDDLPVEDRIRFWSVLADWDGRATIPMDGEDVVIPSNWNMMYDVAVADAKKVKSLEINGKLTFLPGADRLLKAYNLWVRSGELNIGSEAQPFPNKATIELQGDNTEEFFAFTRSIEAGNKNLVITGDANFYGLPRDQRTRLQRTSYRNNKELLVETGLDWVADEMIVIAPTNMRTMDKDSCTI